MQNEVIALEIILEAKELKLLICTSMNLLGSYYISCHNKDATKLDSGDYCELFWHTSWVEYVASCKKRFPKNLKIWLIGELTYFIFT